jgi:hypothetical protein
MGLNGLLQGQIFPHYYFIFLRIYYLSTKSSSLCVWPQADCKLTYKFHIFQGAPLFRRPFGWYCRKYFFILLSVILYSPIFVHLFYVMLTVLLVFSNKFISNKVQSTAAVRKCLTFTDSFFNLSRCRVYLRFGCNLKKKIAPLRARNCCLTMFHAECVGVFMICLHTRFQVPV